jgi:hypothetical protein
MPRAFQILWTLKDESEVVLFMPALFGTTHEGKSFFSCLSDYRCFRYPEMLLLAEVSRDPVAQSPKPSIDNRQIAARLQGAPEPSKHLPWLCKMVVNVVQIDKFNGIWGQTGVVGAA